MLFNQWTGTGRLGRDPEMNYTPSGKAVAKFSIAVDQNMSKDAQGTAKKDTMWLNIVCWERLAERISEKAHKGAEVFVQGRLTMRTYIDKNNQERQAFEVVATSVQLTQRPTQSAPATATYDDLGELDDRVF
jgi:single-strand DNA-binding protein